MAGISPDVDVVVIGAGSAGVGAARAVRAAGRSVLVLEAADRIGGRAFTDRQSLDRPWDQGCAWLHCADVNPLTGWADTLGAEYVKEVWDSRKATYWEHGRWMSEAEAVAVEEGIEAEFEAIWRGAQSGNDLPVSAYLTADDPVRGAARHLLQLLSSADPEDLSAPGYEDYEDTDKNWPMKTGYGDLIERLAEGLPIRTGAPVTRLSERPGGVVADTAGGPVTARAAIVTVSTNVLASGSLRIDSPEAQPALDVLAEVPCGAYEKVAMTLRQPLPGIAGLRFFSIIGADGGPINVQCLGWDDHMVIAHIGGSVARDAARDGPEAQVAYVLERMQMAFGADIAKDITALAPTGWLANPWVRGAYSAARPGHAQARRDLIAAHTGRIGFAGEAMALTWQATAHGAFQSGQDVAARLLAEELPAPA